MLARPHPHQTTHETRVVSEEGADRMPARGSPDLRPGSGEQDGEGEDREPHCGQDGDDAEPQPFLVAGAEDADLGLDDEHEQEDEEDQSADISHAPAESRDPADIAVVGDADHDAVVGHLGEFEEHAARGQKQQPQPEVIRGVADEEEPEHGEHDDSRVHSQPQPMPTPGVGTGASGRSDHGDDEAGGGHRPAQGRGAGFLGGGHGLRQIRGEHEGDDDGVESGRTPIPERPVEDAELVAGTGLLRRRDHGATVLNPLCEGLWLPPSEGREAENRFEGG